MTENREAFEDAAALLGLNLTMRCPESEDGEYLYPVTQDAWNIWQEACDWQEAQIPDVSSEVTEQWIDLINRIVPDLSPEPDQDLYLAEWCMWSDRQRIRHELAVAVACTPKSQQPSAVVPEWFNPHSNPPAHYQPVVGYHPEWIDSSNHAGVRECFTTGYGNVWLNSAWLEGADSYQTGKMVPLLWTHMPAPPKQEVIGDE